jgi:hypothetical protein
LQHRVHLFCVPDIGHDAQPADGFGHPRAGFGVAFPDGDRGAERGQSFGDTPPDALSAAGDDRDTAGEQDIGRIDGHDSS